MATTLYFTIAEYKNKRFFRPINSIKTLVPIFKDPEVIDANVRFYNRYTSEFLKNHNVSGEFYYSSEYDYNPNIHAFNFYKIHACTDEDFEKMQYVTEFDVNKEIINGDDTTKSFIDKITSKYPCPSIHSGFYVEEKNWKFLVRNIMKHKNTMLIGPTGTGKTEIIMKICNLLNIDCHIYDMGSMQDPLTDLLGSHRLENGSSVFDYAKFVDDVQKPGVILLDELSRAPLMTNNILFPCLDSRRQLPVEIADSKHDRIIKVHPECTFIATANIGSEYSGTNEIDAALLNRFLPIQLDYLPANIEMQILSIRTGVDNNTAMEVVSKFNAIRNAYLQTQLSKSVSTRELIACGELIADGFTVGEALDYTVCQKYLNSTYNNELSAVRRIIAGI